MKGTERNWHDYSFNLLMDSDFTSIILGLINMDDVETKRIGVDICELSMHTGGISVWARPLASNYYVQRDDTTVAYISSGPKAHFYVSIFYPKGGGTHYSYTTEHSSLEATVFQILENIDG